MPHLAMSLQLVWPWISNNFTINPAKRLSVLAYFASMIGYGPHAFISHWWWTWGAWVVQLLAVLPGALIYDIFHFTLDANPQSYPDNGSIENRVELYMRSSTE
ncbi:BAH_G0016110.mRNA.1.CDS.1 [Saccharomyces cerevisiae]|nr:BAH_G0016110.mRNA.1.CDS.1 [Saccharomyces cerevisiae]CAI7110860.1 BAH_G0016110.mRNA.1.CDS.1 [Saccharomyces cerevisiae]